MTPFLTIMTTKRQIFVAAMIPGFVLGFERCRVVADLPARRHREVGAASTAHHYPEPLATGHNRVGSLGIILFSGQCLISRSETVLLYGERSRIEPAAPSQLDDLRVASGSRRARPRPGVRKAAPLFEEMTIVRDT